MSQHPRVRVRVQPISDRLNLVHLSDRVAVAVELLKRRGKGGRLSRSRVAYFGFKSLPEAVQFASQLRGRFPKIRLEARASKRLGCAFEVKVCSESAEQLAWEVVRQSVPTSAKVATHIADYRYRQELQRQAERKAQAIASAPLQGKGNRTLVAAGSGLMVGID
ncbi:hypothetical protein IFO70_33320 [Phormidium tenue FACHB-886]|nr:hypothetical protein [Phormidium tenue FACHB-886]